MPDNIAVAFDTASTFVHVSELLLLPFFGVRLCRYCPTVSMLVDVDWANPKTLPQLFHCLH